MKSFHGRILAGLILIAALAGCATATGPQEDWFSYADRLMWLSSGD